MTNNKNSILVKKVGLWLTILVIFATIIISFVSTSADVKYNQREILKIEERSFVNADKIVVNEKEMIGINGRLDAIDASLARIEKSLGTDREK